MEKWTCPYCKKTIDIIKKQNKTGHLRKCQSWVDYKKNILTKEYLYNEYIIKNRSSNDIAIEHMTSANVIITLLKKCDIKNRNMCEANSTDNKLKKYKQTCVDRYGTENTLSKESPIRHKMEMDVLEKYGVENVFQLDGVKEKIKQTCMDKYGVDHCMKSDDNISIFKMLTAKTKEEWDEIILKRESTCLKIYGVMYPQQNEDIKDKTKQTNLERYGVMCPLNNDNIVKKIKQKYLERYGFEHATQSDIVKKKIMDTNMKRYGVPYGFLKGCSNRITTPHKKMVDILLKHGIKHSIEVYIKPYIVDILIDNIIIEIYGDYWHANPRKYLKNDVLSFPEKQILVSDIWMKDKKRENYLRSQNFDFHIFWEYDINRKRSLIEAKLLKIVGYNENKKHSKNKKQE